MKRRYPMGVFWLSVLTNFLFRFFYLSLPGAVLCIIGIWNKTCLLIGAGLLLLDFVLSLIDQIIIAKTAVKESDSPEFNEMMDAFCNGGMDDFRGLVEEKIRRQSNDEDGEDL